MFSFDIIQETARSLRLGYSTLKHTEIRASEYMLESLPQSFIQGYLLMSRSVKDFSKLGKECLEITSQETR